MKKIINISSKDNELIKRTCKLTVSSSYRKQTGLYVADGLRLCRDAAINNVKIDYCLMTDTFITSHKEDADIIINASKSAYTVTDRIMEKLTDTNTPQGVICVFSVSDEQEFTFKNDGKYLILENISDPANLGGIARTAEALGIDAIVVSGGCDAYNPKALRSSMGALMRFNIIKTDNLPDTISKIKNCGIKVLAAVLDENACVLGKVNMTDACAVVIGNEANGITESTKKMCNSSVIIPMSGKAESLNAHAAAAIIIWEMVK